MVRLPLNVKQTYWLNSKASNVTNWFDLHHDLDLGFSRSNMEFPISQPKVVRLPRNEKQTYRLNSRPQMWPMGLTLTVILTFEIWRSNVTLTFDHTWPWPWIFMVKFWNSCISEWEGRLTLHKGCGSRLFMTMTLTIWWLRSGVWIYQIVAGVTSVVGMPSTHLVFHEISLKQHCLLSALVPECQELQYGPMSHYTHRSYFIGPWEMWKKFYKCFFFQFILQIDILNTSCEISLNQVSKNPVDDKSTLV